MSTYRWLVRASVAAICIGYLAPPQSPVSALLVVGIIGCVILGGEALFNHILTNRGRK